MLLEIVCFCDFSSSLTITTLSTGKKKSVKVKIMIHMVFGDHPLQILRCYVTWNSECFCDFSYSLTITMLWTGKKISVKIWIMLFVVCGSDPLQILRCLTLRNLVAPWNIWNQSIPTWSRTKFETLPENFTIHNTY